MKRVILVILTSVFILGSCKPGSIHPKVINHSEPGLKVEPLPVVDLPQSFELSSVCSTIEHPNALWGGLTPAYPMAECAVTLGIRDASTVEPPYLFLTGCIMPEYHSLIIYKDGGYQNLDTLDKLQAVFAPIDSADEALSYALLATGFQARFGQIFEPKLEYFVRTMEDTYVKKIASGWLVHLFTFRLCGCGEHFYSAMDVTVSPAGAISVPDPVHLFEDPETRGVCVD